MLLWFWRQASGIAGYIIAVWSTLTPQVQGATVSGVFTLLSAVGAAGVVFWQLRRQAENSTASNRHTEVLKLKKDVYVEITKACLAVSKAQTDLLIYAQRFEGGLDFAERIAHFGSESPPLQRAVPLSALYFDASHQR